MKPLSYSKVHNQILRALLGLLMVFSVLYSEMRTWTSASDSTNTFKGELIKSEGGSVQIKNPQGKIFSLKLEQLSQVDRYWILNFQDTQTSSQKKNIGDGKYIDYEIIIENAFTTKKAYEYNMYIVPLETKEESKQHLLSGPFLKVAYKSFKTDWFPASTPPDTTKHPELKIKASHIQISASSILTEDKSENRIKRSTKKLKLRKPPLVDIKFSIRLPFYTDLKSYSKIATSAYKNINKSDFPNAFTKEKDLPPPSQIEDILGDDSDIQKRTLFENLKLVLKSFKKEYSVDLTAYTKNLADVYINKNLTPTLVPNLLQAYLTHMNVPSRIQEGYLIYEKRKDHYYRWLEYYVPENGWRPIDPVLYTEGHIKTFEELIKVSQSPQIIRLNWLSRYKIYGAISGTTLQQIPNKTYTTRREQKGLKTKVTIKRLKIQESGK